MHKIVIPRMQFRQYRSSSARRVANPRLFILIDLPMWCDSNCVKSYWRLHYRYHDIIVISITSMFYAQCQNNPIRELSRRQVKGVLLPVLSSERREIFIFALHVCESRTAFIDSLDLTSRFTAMRLLCIYYIYVRYAR